MLSHDELDRALGEIGALACPCCGAVNWSKFERESAHLQLVTTAGEMDEGGAFVVNVAGAGPFRCYLWVCQRCGFVRLIRPELLEHGD